MKNLGLLSIVLSWVGLLFLIRKWKGDTSMTFSQHAAQHKSSQLYYFLLWLICLPLFIWFLVFWFAPSFNMHWSFVLFSWLSGLGLAVAAIVPETEGWKVSVHRFSAFAMCYFMFAVTIIVGLSNSISLAGRITAWVAIASMIGQIAYINKVGRYHQKMLYFQAAYIAAFHLTILIATYTS